MSVLVGLDFETFYDPKAQFTLAKMPVLEYVRDPRFAVHGAGMTLGLTKPRWLDHRQLGAALTELRRRSRHITGLAHNAAFDATVLWETYGIKFDRWICTMAMAQAAVVPYTGRASLKAVAEYLGLGQKDARILDRTAGRYWHQFLPDEQQRMAAYACEDTHMAVMIFWKLYPETPEIEMEMIDWTVRSFVDAPFTLDEQVLVDELARIKAHKQKLLDDVGLIDRVPLMSASNFALLLNGIGVEVETKDGKTGPIPALAKTDKFMQSLLEHEDERVQMLAAARLGHKSTIGETRAAVLLRVARTRDRHGLACMGAPIRYHAAHTGRWGGTDHQNYQNFERPDAKRGRGEIRKALKPNQAPLIRSYGNAHERSGDAG